MFRSAGIRPPQTVTQYCFAGIAMGAIWLAESAVVAWYCQPTEAQMRMDGHSLNTNGPRTTPCRERVTDWGPFLTLRRASNATFRGRSGERVPNKFNVKTFEILPTKKEPLPLSGVVHASAVRPDLLESASTVRRHNPIVKNGMKVIGGCRIDIVDFDPIHYDTSNTPALFGAGQIDKIREVAIRGQSLRRSVTSLTREFDLDFKSTPTGRVRILPDGRIGKFGWKAQFATLKEFVAAACAGELGLSNHLRKQHVAQEYREDTDAELDMTRQQFAALVAYVETIPAPRRERPSDATQTTVVERGEALFSSVGCADCHIPDLDGTQGIYSDFSLHSLTDEANDGYSKVPDVPLPDDHPKLNEWKTPALWGVADSAPYFHDGGSPDLPSAIERHGGAARHVREKYRALPQPDQQALVSFLKTLRAPLP